MAADVLPGIFSIGAAENTFKLIGIDPAGSRLEVFCYTLLTTCIQGAILNLLISIYMLVVYGLIRWFGWGMKQQRGFEVIMPEALPVAQASVDKADEGSR